MAQTKGSKVKVRRGAAGAQAIVAPDPFGGLKRQAQAWGLILHGGKRPAARRRAGKNARGK